MPASTARRTDMDSPIQIKGSVHKTQTPAWEPGRANRPPPSEHWDQIGPRRPQLSHECVNQSRIDEVLERTEQQARDGVVSTRDGRCEAEQLREALFKGHMTTLGGTRQARQERPQRPHQPRPGWRLLSTRPTGRTRPMTVAADHKTK